MKKSVALLSMVLLLIGFCSCTEDDPDISDGDLGPNDTDNDSDRAGDTDGDADSDTDTDGDTDTDVDADTDADTDADSDGDVEPEVPANEIWVRLIIHCSLDECASARRLNVAAWKNEAASSSGKPPEFTLLEKKFSTYPLDKIYKTGEDLLSNPKKWTAGELTFEAFHDMSYSPIEWSAVKGDPRQESKQTVTLEKGKLAVVEMTLHLP